jgi:hypothetical protein
VIPRAATALRWSVTAALALAALFLLLRNSAAIPSLVALDPNEGWNAAHAIALMSGHALYPPPRSLMVNNYPPLSFYVVGALTRLTGDAVIAGRLLSLLSFLAASALIAAIARRMGAPLSGPLFAVIFFAAVLLIASDYVGMDDPQLLGHGLQLAALLALLRGQSPAAAVIFAVSLFVKHNLLALPLASMIWLWRQDRTEALHFAAVGGGLLVLGLLLFRLTYGVSLLSVIATPRLISLDNIAFAISHLWWAVLPLAALARLPHPKKDFCLAYAGTALIFGLAFSAGDGVDTNAFFDLAIACALILGLTVEQSVVPATLSAAALLGFLFFNFHDNNFFYTRAFAAQSARDIEFLKSRSGPALCDQLSLCLWADKEAEVDAFNIGEQIKTGARDPAALVDMIAHRHFAVVQLQDLDALGPAVRAAIAKSYRLDHSDDNGSFFAPLF